MVQNTLNTLSTLNTLFLGGGAGLHGRAVVDREVRGVGKEACPPSTEVTVVKKNLTVCKTEFYLSKVVRGAAWEKDGRP